MKGKLAGWLVVVWEHPGSGSFFIAVNVKLLIQMKRYRFGVIIFFLIVRFGVIIIRHL